MVSREIRWTWNIENQFEKYKAVEKLNDIQPMEMSFDDTQGKF